MGTRTSLDASLGPGVPSPDAAIGGPSGGLVAYGADANVYVIPAQGGTPTNLTASLTGDAGAVTASDPGWAPPCAPIP